MNLSTTDLEGLKSLCIFNKHAPIKTKYIRAHEATFMTKELHKAIMKRIKLRNKSLKSRTLCDRKTYITKKSLKKTIKKHQKNLFQ